MKRIYNWFTKGQASPQYKFITILIHCKDTSDSEISNHRPIHTFRLPNVDIASLQTPNKSISYHELFLDDTESLILLCIHQVHLLFSCNAVHNSYAAKRIDTAMCFSPFFSCFNFNYQLSCGMGRNLVNNYSPSAMTLYKVKSFLGEHGWSFIYVPRHFKMNSIIKLHHNWAVKWPDLHYERCHWVHTIHHVINAFHSDLLLKSST